MVHSLVYPTTLHNSGYAQGDIPHSEVDMQAQFNNNFITSNEHSSDLAIIVPRPNSACGFGKKTMLQMADIMADIFCGPDD